MNKRVDLEAVAKPSKRNAKRTRRSTPSKSKKRLPLAFIEGSSSEEESQFATFAKKRNNRSTRQATTLQKTTHNVEPSTSSHSKSIRKRNNFSAEKVYEVSDSSDDELIAIPCARNSPIETICLGDTDASSNDIPVISDNIIEAPNNEQENYCRPSTSEVVPSSPVVTDEIQLIGNLFESSQNLSQTYLRTLRELTEKTNQLLESSWNFINKEPRSVTDEPAVYVCTDRDEMKNSTRQITGEPVDPDLSDLTDTEEQEQNIKTECPICLESLGTSFVSATTCGHTFCTPCIESCVKSYRKCPTCRKRLTIEMIHPLFLF